MEAEAVSEEPQTVAYVGAALVAGFNADFIAEFLKDADLAAEVTFWMTSAGSRRRGFCLALPIRADAGAGREGTSPGASVEKESRSGHVARLWLRHNDLRRWRHATTAGGQEAGVVRAIDDFKGEYAFLSPLYRTRRLCANSGEYFNSAFAALETAQLVNPGNGPMPIPFTSASAARPYCPRIRYVTPRLNPSTVSPLLCCTRVPLLYVGAE